MTDAALVLGPNVEAFLGGVKVVLSVVFVVVTFVGGLSLFRRMVGA